MEFETSLILAQKSQYSQGIVSTVFKPELHEYYINKEYERAVIFRLGRLLSGGARGPGIFFILPCVDSYTKVDMRVLTYDVPPQEVE